MNARFMSFYKPGVTLCDDVVVKTKHNDQFITDLIETFENLRKFKWKLNQTKCVFGVPFGKLLGFIVSSWGIEANPTKVNAIRFMKPPRSDEAYRVHGRLE